MKRNPLKNEIEAAKRALEKAVSAHKSAIRHLEPKLEVTGTFTRITDPAQLAFRDVTFTHPNAAQVAGYVRRVEKLAKLIPDVATAGAEALNAVIAAGAKIAELKKQNDEQGAAMEAERTADEANPDRKAAREIGFTEATLALVKIALAPTEAHLKAAYFDAKVRNYRNVIAKLEAAGWDMQKAFPSPSSSRDSREQYRSAAEARANAEKFTTWDYSKRTLDSNRIGGPEPVKLKRTEAEQLAKLEADAANDAKLALQSYCWKIAGKIESELVAGDTVKAVTYRGTGNPWGWSFVDVTTAAGAQCWKTQMIVNFSVYGKPFNQWPTRLEWSKGGKTV